MHQIKENAGLTFTFQNEKLNQMCITNQRIQTPTYGDQDSLVGTVMNDLTCSIRYPGQNITDLRKHAVNLVTFPSLHFLQFSHGPYIQYDKKYVPPTLVDIKESLFGESAFMTDLATQNGKWLTSSVTFRGQISSFESSEMALN